MVDFEKAAMEAAKRVFPETTIKGCYFHFCQCIFRHVQAIWIASGVSEKCELLATHSMHRSTRIHSRRRCLQELQRAQRNRVFQNQIGPKEEQRIQGSIQIRRRDMDWKNKRSERISKRSLRSRYVEHVRYDAEWIATNEQRHGRLA